MESAPLTEARAHVRKAAVLAHKSNLQGAREEHKTAAEYFAKAKATTKDPEAVRILSLLEEQHYSLSQPSPGSPISNTKSSDSTHPPGDVQAVGLNQSSSFESKSNVQREMRAGIAHTLAKARGTLSSPTPQSSSKTPRNPLGPTPYFPKSTPSSSTSRHLNPGSSTLSSSGNIHATAATESNRNAANEKGFAQFYKALEEGSVPFPILATLPQSDEAHNLSSKSLSNLLQHGRDTKTRDQLSATTLRALRGRNPAESFIFVQSTGGTESYARILQRPSRTSGEGGGSHLPSIQEDGDLGNQQRHEARQPHQRTRCPSDTKAKENDVSSGDDFVDADGNASEPGSRVGSTTSFTRPKGGSGTGLSEGPSAQSKTRKSRDEVEMELMMLRSVINKLNGENKALKARLGVRSHALAPVSPDAFGATSAASPDAIKDKESRTINTNPSAKAGTTPNVNPSGSSDGDSDARRLIQKQKTRIQELESQVSQSAHTIAELTDKYQKKDQQFKELLGRWRNLEDRARKSRDSKLQLQQQREREMQETRGEGRTGGGGSDSGVQGAGPNADPDPSAALADPDGAGN